MADVVITSFGYGHAPAPEADLTIDARRHLRNPHADPTMRQLTDLDAVVRKHVLATPGAHQLIRHAAATAKDLLAVARQHPVTVAVGCVGGRHRSTAIAREIGAPLQAQGVAVAVEHRDVHRPVIQPISGGAA